MSVEHLGQYCDINNELSEFGLEELLGKLEKIGFLMMLKSKKKRKNKLEASPDAGARAEQDCPAGMRCFDACVRSKFLRGLNGRGGTGGTSTL
jgi:hypothetical protein